MKNLNRHSRAGGNPVIQIIPRVAGRHSSFVRYAGMTKSEVTE